MHLSFVIPTFNFSKFLNISLESSLHVLRITFERDSDIVPSHIIFDSIYLNAPSQEIDYLTNASTSIIPPTSPSAPSQEIDYLTMPPSKLAKEQHNQNIATRLRVSPPLPSGRVRSGVSCWT